MTYLFDTNACISYLNRLDSPIQIRMKRLSPETISLCSVVEAELHFGVMNSARPVENLVKLNVFLSAFNSFPFDSQAAQKYGKIRAELSHAGKPIGPNDLMIAAIALVHGSILVTHNTREFSRIKELKLEDWEASQSNEIG
jgi:tRNA(fMet)-specific endonuclease VapC